jgi:glycosyltransferase involved in cell wall biosynthesis
MRILVLAYDYAPYLNPRSLRWTSIVEEWTAAGHSVDVVTAWKPGDAAQENRNGATIYRVSRSLWQKVSASMSRAEGTQIQAAEKAARWPHFLVRALRWLHRATWRRLRWPDYARYWHRTAFQTAIRLCQVHSYDALVTVSYPFTPHLIGLRLKRRYKSLYWLADMGDPFSFLDASPLNNSRLFHGLNRWAERRVFSRSDAVSVTTPETRDLYGDVFPDHAAQVRVIPPLLTQEQDVPTDQLFAPNDGVFRLVYVGTVYRTLRNPGPAMALLREAQRHLPFSLELHVFGDVHDCVDLFEESQSNDSGLIHLHGSVSHQVALQAMRDADMLVNIGNDTRYQLPSKVVEYVASGRPILNVSRHEEDSSAAFFARYPRVLALSHDSEQWDATEVGKLVRFMKDADVSTPIDVRELIRPFLSQSIADEYLGMVQMPSER